MNIIDYLYSFWAWSLSLLSTQLAFCFVHRRLLELKQSAKAKMKTLLLFVVAILLDPCCLFGSRFAYGYSSPTPNPKSVVKYGKARFTVLTDHLIRMEWDVNGQVTDAATFAFINRLLPAPQYTVTQQANGIIIQTSALKVPYIHLLL